MDATKEWLRYIESKATRSIEENSEDNQPLKKDDESQN